MEVKRERKKSFSHTNGSLTDATVRLHYKDNHNKSLLQQCWLLTRKKWHSSTNQAKWKVTTIFGNWYYYAGKLKMGGWVGQVGRQVDSNKQIIGLWQTMWPEKPPHTWPISPAVCEKNVYIYLSLSRQKFTLLSLW